MLRLNAGAIGVLEIKEDGSFNRAFEGGIMVFACIERLATSDKRGASKAMLEITANDLRVADLLIPAKNDDPAMIRNPLFHDKALPFIPCFSRGMVDPQNGNKVRPGIHKISSIGCPEAVFIIVLCVGTKV